MTRQTFKKALIILHDLAATMLALVLTFAVRFEGIPLEERLHHLPTFVPISVVYAGLVYGFFGLYQSKWRFASLPDLANITKAVTVLTLTLLVADYILVSPQLYNFFFFGKVTIGLYWLIQMFLLGGPRMVYRYLKYHQSQRHQDKETRIPVLLLGRGSDVEVVLRAIETGSIKKLKAVGILSPRSGDQGQSIRDVPVLGSFNDLDRVVTDFAHNGPAIRRLVALPSALVPEAKPEQLLVQSRRLSLPLMRMNSLDEGAQQTDMAPLDIEDLLLRPSVHIELSRLSKFISNKRILVTGGGGSIGSELCARSVAFGASHLLILENSEPSLHHALEMPSLVSDKTHVEGIIADIRDEQRITDIFDTFKPDVVFHAAALKHVPYLEKDWAEGIKTNIFGSLHVIDAAIKSGAKALVMISTDKAIEPVSMLGATKRFAEIIAQSRDAELNQNSTTRLIAVRFGNVLGSVGSVVPKFKAQIARGGPVTITHPDMVRYFMSVREAVDLVITAASHADQDARLTQEERAAVYVLKMGQPVRIMELAERMIRLAGFEPGEDIDIETTGTRPGERMHEILFDQKEPMLETGIDGIMAAKPLFADHVKLSDWLERLQNAVAAQDRDQAEHIFEEAIPDFKMRHKSKV